MATEHTSTEMVPESDLAHDAGRFIAQAAARHVAFVCVDELLRNAGESVRVELTVDRQAQGAFVAFTAHARVAAAVA